MHNRDPIGLHSDSPALYDQLWASGFYDGGAEAHLDAGGVSDGRQAATSEERTDVYWLGPTQERRKETRQCGPDPFVWIVRRG